MKKLIVSAACIIMLVGCRKEYKTLPTPSTVNQVPQKDFQDFPKCGNDLSPEFSAKMMKARRSRNEHEIVNRRKPKDNPDAISTPTVIFLDADGHTVENTIWNVFNSGNAFHCPDPGLTTDQMNAIIKSVSEDFSTFQITVTSDENLFNNTLIERRIRVIITHYRGLENIFPFPGGIAEIGSFWFKDDSPCFVFADTYSGHSAHIAEVVSHEAGHTIGLIHQAEYNSDGTLKYLYHSGFYSFPWAVTWRAIMGSGFNGDISGWMSGRALQGVQNDTEMLSAVGVQADEVSNSFLTAKQLKFNDASKRVSFKELMNKPSDADFYAVNTGQLKFSITGGGNCDIKVVAYNRDEQLIAEFNDNNSLGISEKTIKTKGNKIYLKVVVNDLLIGDLFSEIQYAGHYNLVVKKI